MDTKLMYNSSIIRALYFAGKAHKEQVRKGSDEIPYLVHPVEVAMILKDNNMSEDIIVAGLLHDILEDTEKNKADIEKEFGSNVLNLVIGASEELEGRDKRAWKERKEHTIQHLSGATFDIKCVSCADKLSNIRSMIMDYEVIGDELWERFNEKNPCEQKWYYDGLVESLKELEQYDMYKEFKCSVHHLFKKANCGGV